MLVSGFVLEPISKKKQQQAKSNYFFGRSPTGRAIRSNLFLGGHGQKKPAPTQKKDFHCYP
ncbi:hypothetical protein B0A58_00505 [Flavobacterium branchiophilum NBRC 15030 = ATCC 35035]|nr:hypothetical protein B0A58_00505 [Flavobacterium branchiophilum NBRC 15030 = ATCC 35035]